MYRTYHIETGMLYRHLLTILPEINVDTVVLCPLANVILYNHTVIRNRNVLWHSIAKAQSNQTDLISMSL